jgi:anti-anti-sigma factor
MSRTPRDVDPGQTPVPPPSPLRIQDVASDGQRLLRLEGDLDAASIETVELALREAFASKSHSVVVLDLGRVTFMDSHGLRMVLIAHALCTSDGVEFRVLPGPARVQRLFETTGFHDLFFGT